MLNQLLTKDVHWDENISKMGWLQFDPSTVREMFKQFNESQIKEVAQSIKGDVIKGIKFIYGDATLQHTIDFIDSWLTVTNMQFKHSENPESHKFLVNHQLGKNWSTFAIEVSENFLKDLGFKMGDIHTDKDSYSFSISK